MSLDKKLFIFIIIGAVLAAFAKTCEGLDALLTLLFGDDKRSPVNRATEDVRQRVNSQLVGKLYFLARKL